VKATLGVWDWTFEPTVTVGLAALVVGLRDRGTAAAAEPGRRRLALAQLTTLARLALRDRGAHRVPGARVNRSTPAVTATCLSLHMIQHLVLMMVSPPLVLLGTCGLRPPDPARAPRLRRLWTAITRPPARQPVIFNAVLLVWHIPALYDTTPAQRDRAHSRAPHLHRRRSGAVVGRWSTPSGGRGRHRSAPSRRSQALGDGRGAADRTSGSSSRWVRRPSTSSTPGRRGSGA